MHIFTANIPIFHSRYRRQVLITNEFHKFFRSTISGTSDDGYDMSSMSFVDRPYGPKSIHILIMSKISGVHRQYDMEGRCDKARAQPTQSGASQPHTLG
jgi:hypothetical protein